MSAILDEIFRRPERVRQRLTQRVKALFAPSPSPRPAITPQRMQAALATLAWIHQASDPDEILKRAGIGRWDLRRLEADDEVAQALDTRRDALVATPWRLEPNQTRAAKFLEAELMPHMASIISGAFSAVPYGYSVLQANYQPRAKGRIGLSAVWECPQAWFTPAFTGELFARTILYSYSSDPQSLESTVRRDATQTLAAQPGDCLTHRYPYVYFPTVRNGSFTNPYGEALLSRLYFPVTWRREGWSLWLTFLETFGAPIVVGKVQNYDAFVEAMTAQGIRSTVAFPSGNEADEFQTIAASTPGEFERLEQALIARIQKLILGQTLTSNVGDTGSYAAAQVHNEIRQDKRNADIRLITPTVQAIIEALAVLNGLIAPTFVMADDTGLESSRAERDAKLLPVLEASGLRLTREYYLDRYDYQDADLSLPQALEEPADPTGEGTEEPGAPTPSGDSDQAPETEATNAQARAQFATKSAGHGRFTQAQTAVESLIIAAMDRARELPIDLDALRDAVIAAESPADLERRLGLILEQDSPEFQEVLALAQFAANVLGYVAAEEGKS